MEPARMALITAVIVGVVTMRLRGEPLRVRSLLMVPAILTAVGVWELGKHGNAGGTGGIAFLGLGVLVGAGFGWWRGRTIELSERDGHLFYRYRISTVAIWAAAIAARLLLTLVQHAGGIGSTGSSTLMVSIGASLLGEAAIVYRRARALGVPFAPDDRHRSARVRL